MSLVSGTTPSSLSQWREEALQVAFVSGKQLMYINDVVGVDVRPEPGRPSMQLQLEFEHRSAVLGVHFSHSLFRCLVIGSISLLYEVLMLFVKWASVPIQSGYKGNGRGRWRVSVYAGLV